MNKSLLIIKNQIFIYKNKEYLFDEFEEIENLLSNDREIIILEEELYSKHFRENLKKKHIYEFINGKLNKEFHKNDDILYHYDYDKKKKIISIYSIKGGKRLDILSQGSRNIEVKPIQFIIKDIMISLLGDIGLTSKYIILFNETYYYISLNNGKFCYAFVEKEIKLLLNRINNISPNESIEQEESTLYVDINVYNHIKKMNNNINDNVKLININCEDLLYEKIYKKQIFHFTKIL